MKNSILIVASVALLLVGCASKKQSSASAAKKSPVLIVDGKVVTDSLELKLIKPEVVESIEVIKPDKKSIDYLIKEYGPKAKDGVVIVTTKRSKEDKQKEMLTKLGEYLEDYEQNPGKYLFVKDGILVLETEIVKLKGLTYSDLLAVESITLKAAKAIYGDDARENTIVINTTDFSN